MIIIKNLSKSYDVAVLKDINLEIHPTQILAIIGHNGSGKSTLLSILTGVTKQSAGEIFLHGKKIEFASVLKAKKLGFELLTQRPAIFPELSILENLFAGNEPCYNFMKGEIINKTKMKKLARSMLSQISLDIKDLNRPIASFSGGQKAIVVFLRTLNKLPIFLALDEPTAPLGPKERDTVNNIIMKAAAKGVMVALVTHNLSDVINFCQKVAILKNGSIVYYGSTSDLTEVDLKNYM